MTQTTESEFYNAVAKACDAAGINDTGRHFVEMYCAENGYGSSDSWGVALSTLETVLDQADGLEKVAANQSPYDAWVKA